MDHKVISEELLRHFTEEVFIKMGHSKQHAYLAADVLLLADLRGIDSHGVARLPGYYRLWESGRVNAAPKISIQRESPSTAVVNADGALGLISAPIAMDWAIEKSKKVGTGWIAVNNSNHFGIAAYHAMKALEHDMMGWAMTNASALVAPTFSKQRMLGTNPIAFAAPADEENNFVLDMATTTAANGKLEIASRNLQSIPEGWAINQNGAISTHPDILQQNGMLLPLGSDALHGSHKGYGLGAMVDILTGVLSGAAFSKWVPPFPAYVPMPTNAPGKGVGHFLGAMKIDAFQSVDDFKKNMDIWIRSMKEAEPIQKEQKVMIHGEPELYAQMERKVSGIPIHNSVWQSLDKLAQSLNLELSEN